MKFIGSENPYLEVESQAVMCQIQSGNGIVVLKITLTESASLGAGSSVPAGLCPLGVPLSRHLEQGYSVWALGR